MRSKSQLIPVIAGILFLFYSCVDVTSDYETLTGRTQGTTYKIMYSDPGGVQRDVITDNLDSLLSELDNTFSLYNASSVISAFNRNEDFTLTDMFLDVFNISMEISEMTDGLFDITVAPLVRAMGFGPDTFRSADTAIVDSLLTFTGYSKLSLEDGRIIKSDYRTELDMNSVAKGYSVDMVALMLENLGIESYLVEIGGEVRVKGLYGDRHWRIGIDRPYDSNISPGETLSAVIEMDNDALATSGNYRNFFLLDGVRYSHTIDPRTGRSAYSRLLSATVVTSDCARADAWATAFMVAGVELSKEIVENDKQLEAILIYSDEDGGMKVWISQGLRERVQER
jgi:FAD:protein FMN transferase